MVHRTSAKSIIAVGGYSVTYLSTIEMLDMDGRNRFDETQFRTKRFRANFFGATLLCRKMLKFFVE
jgi:hypothetical protein